MDEKLSIQDLVSLLIDKHSMTQENAEQFVAAFFELIKEELQNEGAVKVKGLGVFKKIAVESRDSISVNSGERIQIEGYNKIVFAPEASVRDLINKPFSHFESVVLKDSTVFDDMTEAEIEELAADCVEEEETDTLEVEQNQEEVPAETSETLETSETSEALETPDTPSLPEPPVVKAEEQTNTSEPKATETEIPVVEPPIQQEEEKSVAQPQPPSKGNWVNSLFIIVLIIVGLCIGFICYLYSDAFYAEAEEEGEEETTLSKPEQASPLATDTLHALTDTTICVPMNCIDSIPAKDTNAKDTNAKAVVQPQIKPAVEEATVKKEKSAPKQTRRYSESKSYKISGTKATHTLKSGNTLMKLSLKYYGTKAFWFYIVQYNKDVIQDPDNVPIGTTLKIPELIEK